MRSAKQTLLLIAASSLLVQFDAAAIDWNGTTNDLTLSTNWNGDLTISNTGNSYTGGTTIESGATLKGSSFSLQGIFTDKGTLIFNQSTNGAFAGTINGPSSGTIIKTGVGRLAIITSQAGFNGTTNIDQGTLSLLNTLGGSVNILSEGILAGTGTILKNVSNSGIISPGTSIGTLNIGGNYTQNVDGLYFCEVDSQGNSDLINVAGTASLDGLVVVSLIDGVLNKNATYTILHANGGVEGSFKGAYCINSYATPVLTYLSNDVQLVFANVSPFFANTHNERVVEKQLNSIDNPTSEEIDIFKALALLGNNPSTIDEARRALAQMGGEQYTNNALLAEISTRQFIRRLYDPLRVLIAATSCCHSCDCCSQPYYLGIDPSCIDALDPWIEIGGGRTFISHDRRAHGCKADAYEITVGAQATLNKYFTFGIAGGYEFNNVSYNIGGSGRNNMALAGIYGLFRPCGYYFLGDFVVDICHSKIKRPIDIGSLQYHAHSKPSLVQKTLYFEGGKDLFCHGILVQPFLGVEVAQFSGKKNCEHGAYPLNLEIKRHAHTNVYSRLGFHLSSTDVCWTLNVDFGWQYRITPLRSSIKARFVDFGDVFTILGVAIPRNSLDGAINISKVVCDRWELFAELSGQGWSNSTTFSALGGVRCSW